MTAVAPGLTSIFASNANVNSASMPFTTCPITSISLPSLGSGTTQTLAATVTDSNGFKLANNGVVPTGITLPNLSWLSTNQYAAKIAAQTASQSTTTGGVTTTATVQTGSGTVTSGTAGVATLAVSCTPPNCNKNLFPVYSNPVVATASGTPKTALLITSTQGQNLVGFNVATGAFAGIAIGKPPDSFLMNRQGTLGMLGADNSAALIFNPVPATTTTLSVTPVQFNGKVLNISPDGTLAALAGNVPGELQGSIGVVTFATSTLDTFPIAGTATAADFTPDSQYLFVTTQQTTGGVTTNRLYTYQVTGTAKGATVMTLPNATASALDVAVLANGPVGYVAGAGAAGNTNVTAYATCSATPPTHLAADTQSTAPNVETNVRALADGSGAVVLDLPNVELLKPDVPTTKGTLSGCPTTPNTFTEGVTPLTLTTPPAASDVNQFLITPDGTKAVITSKSSGKIYVVQLSSGALTVMSLANNATLQNPSDATKSFKGDIAADSSTFYVGAAETAVSATCPVSATAPVTPPCYTVQAVDLTGASAPSVLITSSTLNAQGLLQPDGVTTATPDFVVIRNQ
jgi:hypothetical protein